MWWALLALSWASWHGPPKGRGHSHRNSSPPDQLSPAHPLCKRPGGSSAPGMPAPSHFIGSKLTGKPAGRLSPGRLPCQTAIPVTGMSTSWPRGLCCSTCPASLRAWGWPCQSSPLLWDLANFLCPIFSTRGTTAAFCTLGQRARVSSSTLWRAERAWAQ